MDIKTLSTFKSYPSRSEAEAAVMTRLDTCGYSLDDIKDVFDKYQPGHFSELSNYRYQYLTNVYNSIQSICHRPKINTSYFNIKGDKYKHKILRIILSVCHQFNNTSCFLSLEQICEFMNLQPSTRGTYSIAGPNKAIKSLESEYNLIITKGIHSRKGRTGIANTYDISNIINHR